MTLSDSRNNLAHEIEQTIRERYGSTYRVFDTVIPRRGLGGGSTCSRYERLLL